MERVRASRKFNQSAVMNAEESARREVVIGEFLKEISRYKSKEALDEYLKLNTRQRQALTEELAKGKRFDTD